MPEDNKNSTAAKTPEVELSNAGGAAAAQPPSPKPPRGPRFRWLREKFGTHNIYMLIFVLLILIALGTAYAALKIGRNGGNNSPKVSLTDQQLSELKNGTAVVGDSQQVLDIQSNSVFEGQVLVKSNVDVAGSIKVGGGLNLQSISVGGTSTFGAVQVNNNLAVAGSTTLQGSLTVSGSASFSKSVSVGTLNVSSLQLTGDLTVSRHLAVGGTAPSKSSGTALGSGGTVSINGTDTAGTVTINTGGSPPAGCFGTFNFVNKFNSTPHVVISPSNSSAGGLDYYANRATTNFSICTTSVPVASTTYLFDYIVID